MAEPTGRFRVVAGERRLASARAAASEILDEAGFRTAFDTITGLPGYSPTPLVDRADLTERLGVAAVAVKDESSRLQLTSFKALGGSYAVHRAHQRWQADRTNQPFVVTCVTDGNHGAAVAYGARAIDARCVVYLPDVVDPAQERTLSALGAEVRRVPGTYDQVTAVNAADAREHGWTIVTDTSAAETRHPTVVDVMQGYRILAQELVDQWATARPTHLLLQAGCGGFAAAVVAHLLTHLPEQEIPVITLVEPDTAACLQAAAVAGHPSTVAGDLATVMAGLSVGEVSLPAWEILRGSVDHYLSIPDDDVVEAVRLLGTPPPGHTVIGAGETGAAAVAALLGLARTGLGSRLGLDTTSRVLVVNTEGPVNG